LAAHESHHRNRRFWIYMIKWTCFVNVLIAIASIALWIEHVEREALLRFAGFSVFFFNSIFWLPVGFLEMVRFVAVKRAGSSRPGAQGLARGVNRENHGSDRFSSES